MCGSPNYTPNTKFAQSQFKNNLMNRRTVSCEQKECKQIAMNMLKNILITSNHNY